LRGQNGNRGKKTVVRVSKQVSDAGHQCVKEIVLVPPSETKGVWKQAQKKKEAWNNVKKWLEGIGERPLPVFLWIYKGGGNRDQKLV